MDNSIDTLVYSYTRAQAIEDGILINVTETAKEAGIKFPTVVTDHLNHSYIVPSLELAKMGQSIDGRLWDLLMMFRFNACKSNSNILNYICLFQMKPGSEAVEKTIKAHIGPGDTAEPVITLMLPGDN